MSANPSRNPLRTISEEFDWEGYVTENYTVKTTPSGELRICCPSCHESDYKCYINPEKRCWYCFKCTFNNRRGSKFDLVSFVALTEDLSRGNAIKKLLLDYRATTPESLEEAYKERVEAAKAVKLSAGLRVIPGLPPEAVRLEAGKNQEFWDYLIKRGLTEDEILACGIHCVPQEKVLIYKASGSVAGDIGGRILFPVYGGDYKLISWLTRAIKPLREREQKYINCPDSDMSKTLWPFVPPSSKRVVIVEGIFDAIACRRTGVDAYAAFGKHLSKEQINLLKTWEVEEVVVFFDKRDAKKEIMSLVDNHLKNIFKAVYVLNQVNWPEKRDAGDCLSLPDGTAILTSTIADTVNSSSLRYSKWKLEY